MMLSTANLLSPSDGGPVVAPTQDMVLGCYYLTLDATGRSSTASRACSRATEALARVRDGLAPTRATARRGQPRHRSGNIELHQTSRPRCQDADEATAHGRSVASHDRRPGHLQPGPARAAALRTTSRHDAGRACASSSSDCYRLLGPTRRPTSSDGIKSVGFEYATRGGMTISVADIKIPEDKAARLAEADEQVEDIDKQFQRGLITDDERYEQVVERLAGRRPTMSATR